MWKIFNAIKFGEILLLGVVDDYMEYLMVKLVGALPTVVENDH